MLSASAVVVAQIGAMIAVARTPEARDCPDTEPFVARIARISRSPLAAPDRATSLRVEFSRAAGAYEAKVTLEGARQGERVLRDESATCDPLADAVAVTTVLLLDPAWRPIDSDRAAEARAPGWSLWGSARIGASAGLVPGATWMAGAGVEATLGASTSISLAGAWSGPGEAKLGGGAVDVGLWYLELAAFRSLTGETFRLGPSIQLMAGALRGEGTQYPVVSAASLGWLAVGGGVRADVGLGERVRLGARSHVVIPARKHGFSVGNVGTAYETSPVAGVADLVLELRLW